MSFKDEILGTIKSQQEIQNEQFVKDIEDAPRWAESHYRFLKDAIMKEAKENGAKFIDGKMAVEAKYFLHSFSIVEQKTSDPGLDTAYPKRHLLNCKVINEKAFERYMDALNRISVEDDIEVVFCWYYMENGKGHFNPIKNKNDINNINLISRVTHWVKFVLTGKLVLD